MITNFVTIPDFVSFVLTDDLLNKCACKVNKKKDVFDKKMIGPFVAEVENNVKKNQKTFVEENGVRWRIVKKEVSVQARDWYLNQI